MNTLFILQRFVYVELVISQWRNVKLLLRTLPPTPIQLPHATINRGKHGIDVSPAIVYIGLLFNSLLWRNI